MLLDGDLGLANVDVFLGLSPRHTMAHVLSGERTLEEVIVESPQGVQIIPGASGVAELANLSAAGHLSLVQAFSTLSSRVDVMIVDTAAGISHSVMQFSQAAQHVLLVVCDEPASMTDAYALIKVLSRNHDVTRFRVIANMVRAPGEGDALFQKLQRVTGKFLDVTLEYVGEIPEDPYLRKAIREQRPVHDGISRRVRPRVHSRNWRSRPISGLYRRVRAAISSSSSSVWCVVRSRGWRSCDERRGVHR